MNKTFAYGYYHGNSLTEVRSSFSISAIKSLYHDKKINLIFR